jgi:predicted CopG family antitoxin
VRVVRVQYVWVIVMKRKLTITVSEAVYEGLHSRIGKRRISQFIEQLARPHVLSSDIEAAYREMAADQGRERDAMEWSEGLVGDSLPNSHAPR